MSSLIVEVVNIDDVKPHPNADNLEIAVVKGWECIVGKDRYEKGMTAVYVPTDSIVNATWAEAWGVSNYLGKNGRTKPVKLRGVVSNGLIVDVEDSSWVVGQDVAAYYGITKYEPPSFLSNRAAAHGAGKIIQDSNNFRKYTDLENLRHFPDAFKDGELVVVSEKIHGTNSRIGIVDGNWVAGSRRLGRGRPSWVDEKTIKFWKTPLKWLKLKLDNRKKHHNDEHSGVEFWKDEAQSVEVYWMPFLVPGVREMLEYIASQPFFFGNVVLYGEIYGKGIQSMEYGEEGINYVAFDISIDGYYVDPARFASFCRQFGVPTAPLLKSYPIPYSIDTIKELSSGPTILGKGCHIREGVVVKPVEERVDLKGRRVCYKYISDEYLLAKKSDYKDE